ncbi:hypothetical protein IFM89_000019 [Coptis chinensis]|uniref:Uncharacterized protein n=1 Tax=Coptis chinensis TaxID=261450 RepID=A0A835M3A0_9MAGN|nr:hypothetical protein IFM89_000019 [Coptis chinensis]
MAAVISHIFSSSAILTLGLYHLISTTRNHLKSPTSYSAKPYHPFNLLPSSPRLKYLQLYLLIFSLLLAFAHQTFISFESDPLLKGSTPVHKFTSYQSAAVILLFLILSTSLLVSETTTFLPLPNDLFFTFASAVFYLEYSVSSSSASVQTSDLQAKCDHVSAKVSALSSLLCLLLALNPKNFVADVGLGASLCLQGLWVLQTGLSLYVEAFIPEGCHRMLDVVKGVEGSTKCDLEDSRLRAVAILDLVFVIHVMFVVVIVMATYAFVAKSVGIKRVGSYEALSSCEPNHFQMKALEGTQA